MRTSSSRDRKKLERRRLAAGRMFDRGKTQAAVARHFQVSRVAACKWHAQWRADGKNGLRSKGHPGFPSRKTSENRKQLRNMILSGAATAGYATDFWTLERIRAVAKRKLGIALKYTQTWRTVTSLGFSVQKPERRARERDEKAIMDWKQNTFPQLKKIR